MAFVARIGLLLRDALAFVATTTVRLAIPIEISNGASRPGATAADGSWDVTLTAGKLDGMWRAKSAR
ncbi:hypothetical protein HYPGJ_20176 [Hyphomicrobium sp. GJ21]|jgi:hypothetical protein|uniref:hypothetical protein n=1 Tax=Hyphomicrobium sp. GJ21 TaxID=113574 RepID=UPI000622B92B|nr:hypothetical protein [Hyphomicrobium sp. GJ21]CEJ84237.1 hypothetical protein HYPGJ_20176 [Hyphomicrobium sp. GJ21]